MANRGDAQEPADEDGARECSRGNYCAGRKIIMGNGERSIIPALTYSAFCPACRTVISTALDQLPAAYARLAAEIGEPVKRNSSIRTPLGPSLPLRADVDAAMRDIEDTLASWEERTRDVAHLSVMDTRHRSSLAAVEQSTAILSPRLDVLFALEPGPMMRSAPSPDGNGDPDIITIADLGGQDAGEEILRLHYRARAILGEIVKQAEILDGVPCKKCEAMSLERAEPPSDPKIEAMWSQCAVPSCRHAMSRKDFDEWAKWYAGWAKSSGVACRRCQTNRHNECSWVACSCAAGEHRSAA